MPISAIVFKPIIRYTLLSRAALFGITAINIILMMPTARFIGFILKTATPHPARMKTASDTHLMLYQSVPIQARPKRIAL